MSVKQNSLLIGVCYVIRGVRMLPKINSLALNARRPFRGRIITLDILTNVTVQNRPETRHVCYVVLTSTNRPTWSGIMSSGIVPQQCQTTALFIQHVISVGNGLCLLNIWLSIKRHALPECFNASIVPRPLWAFAFCNGIGNKCMRTTNSHQVNVNRVLLLRQRNKKTSDDDNKRSFRLDPVLCP